jgi:hypothetical protein
MQHMEAFKRSIAGDENADDEVRDAGQNVCRYPYARFVARFFYVWGI